MLRGRCSYAIDTHVHAVWVLFVLVSLLITPLGSAQTPQPGLGALDWQSLRTDHFILHYPMTAKGPADPHAISGARLAYRAATFAEETYTRLQAILKDVPRGPIHLVLEPHRIEAQGLAEPEWQRITIAAYPEPAFPPRGGGDWLRETIAHEVAHLMMEAVGSAGASGRMGIIEVDLRDRNWLQEAAGKPLPADPELEGGLRLSIGDSAPFFWVEGGAEYLAEVAGANQWTSGRDMMLRMSTLEDLLLTPSQLQSRLGREGFDGERGYNQGYSFLLFLRERYGEQAFQRILRASGRRFRWNWVAAIEDGQGIPFNTVYQHWKAWLEERYRPLAELKKDPIAGNPLELTIAPWRSADPEVRRRWMSQDPDTRRSDREGQHLAASHPSYSPDGQLLASWEDGLRVRAIPEDWWPAFGGQPLEPFRDRLELARRERRQGFIPEIRPYPIGWAPDGRRMVVVAGENWRQGGRPAHEPYDWNMLFLLDVSLTHRGEVILKVPAPGTPIPNTQRAQDPVFSPDGDWIAFIRYEDGTSNLWMIRPDGSQAHALTEFVDGTTMGHPSWSPDGQQIAFHMFRRNQRDLWLYDLETHSLLPIGLDGADDQDPTWSSDGKIYYSSDVTGIYNLYSFDLNTSEVRRLTDVLGGAFSPQRTPAGNLVFTYFDGYTFKLHGLPSSAALSQPMDNAAFFVDPTLARGYLLGAQEASAAVGTGYRPLAAASTPIVIPILRIRERDVSAGAQLRWEDPLQRHDLRLDLLAGLGNQAYLRYRYQRWRPKLEVGVLQTNLKESVSLRLETDGEASLMEKKRIEKQGVAYGQLDWALGDHLRLGMISDGRRRTTRAREDGLTAKPLHASVGTGPTLTYSRFTPGDHDAEGVDPRGGFQLEARYTLRQSRVWDPVTGEESVDAGQLLGTYLFHRVDLAAMQALALPWGQHSLEWRLNLGWIDRNVAWWDELQAGNRLRTLPPRFDLIVPFPGYSVASLSGETLGIASLAYRFPIQTHIGRSLGPLHVDAL